MDNLRNTKRQQLREKFLKYKQEYQQKKAQGYDVSEAKRLAIEARDAHRRGDNQKARQLAKEAVAALKNAKKIT